jgi:hypothetical protein
VNLHAVWTAVSEDFCRTLENRWQEHIFIRIAVDDSARTSLGPNIFDDGDNTTHVSTEEVAVFAWLLLLLGVVRVLMPMKQRPRNAES